jgi:chromosome segregation ATPase
MQKELTAMRIDYVNMKEKLADLDEQVTDATEQLTKETEVRVAREEELSRVGEALTSAMDECERMKIHACEQAEALDEQTDNASYWKDMRRELSDTNRKCEELMRENNRLEWELLRCAIACSCAARLLEKCTSLC